VTASTNPDVGLTFEATGHLIPQIDVALKAFDKFSSSIFVNLDASTDVIIATSTAHDAQACLSAITTLDVGVGAQASFFDIFDASVRDSLFKETFPLVHVRITTSLSSFALNDDLTMTAEQMLWAAPLYLCCPCCPPVAQRPWYPNAAAAHQHSRASARRSPGTARATWKVCRSCATQGRRRLAVPIGPTIATKRNGGYQLEYPLDGTTLLPLLRYQEGPVHL